MALSELGLTQAEVDQIMADVSGTPTYNPGTPAAPVPVPGQVKPPVGVAPPPPPTKPPVSVTPLGPGLVPTGKAPAGTAAKFAAGPVLVGATTGFVFGGPPGAAVGAGAMFLLSKLITPK